MEEIQASLNGNGKENKVEEVSGDASQGVVEKQNDMAQPSKQTQREQSQEFDVSNRIQQIHNINFLLDIPVQVAVELGRTKMIVRDIVDLGQGSIIELQKPVGKHMEVLVLDKLIARGEVVQRNKKLGVRLTEIVTPRERIEKLR